MGHSARILRDSVSPSGHRLTTFEIVFPRPVLAEFNTHRVFSRNSASSRAIPGEKMVARALQDPFTPIYWGRNQKGMQAGAELNPDEQTEAIDEWLAARDDAVVHTQRLLDIGVHKQIANRLLEPFLWHTVIVTATEWSNFFGLRVDPNAQPEIRRIAEIMLELYNKNQPTIVGYDHWHLPLLQPREELEAAQYPMRWVKICTGRCARVSYLTHDGIRNPEADVGLHDSLLNNGHLSPFEHCARPMTPEELEQDPWSGNFQGWLQYRKTIPNESDFSKVKANKA